MNALQVLAIGTGITSMEFDGVIFRTDADEKVQNQTVKVYPSGDSVELVLPCWPVVFPRFEEFEIVLHKAIDFTDDWIIAERSTGLKLGMDDSPGAAYCMASIRLQGKTPEEFRARIVEKLAARAATQAAPAK